METRDIFHPYLNHLLFSQKIKIFYVSSVDFRVDWQNLLFKKIILKSWMERHIEVKYTSCSCKGPTFSSISYLPLAPGKLTHSSDLCRNTHSQFVCVCGSSRQGLCVVLELIL